VIGKFVFLKGRNLITVSDLNDAPKDYDSIIEFSPEIPEPPHTPEQHEFIESIDEIFKRYIK
jgi:hypothetical protein